MGFSANLDSLDANVAAHLCDAALWLDQGEGQGVACAIQLETSLDGDTLQSATIAAPRSTVEVQVAEVPRLRRGDIFVPTEGPKKDRQFKVTGAPKRLGDGRWWLADVEDLGPVA